MARPGDDLQRRPEKQMDGGDLHVVRGTDTGRARRARTVRRRPAWALLALSLAMLITGMVLPHGLLLAAGLVAAGMAANLFTPARDRTEPRPRLP
ncbi:hypothetical protein OG763_05600 [Streptomyces sp. NBC_01230]|uniref:hypothetical protein n=1 Tax=Streptomyces sp. NBC_01230 TaxID=2903784 RepID=UPI002E15C1AF|nr:hypothetical protein OG763_05600 [Streptomyces sp. NBC_01230]